MTGRKNCVLKYKVSVCIIARNEEKNIGAILGDALQFADEIIVNVNSSTDKTLDIVKNYQSSHGVIKYIQTEWQDDFSLARNQAIDQATLPWIVWLDADDRVSPEAAQGINILAKAPLNRCFAFRIRNGRTDGLKCGPEFYQIRMFPNNESMRFEGRVHEQISIAAQKQQLQRFNIDLEIYHSGYTNAEIKKAKARRNLRLMEMETPKWSIDFTHRAHAHVILDQHAKAIEWFIRAYERPETKTQNPDLYFSLPADIGGQYMMLNQFDKAMEWFDKCDSENIEGLYQKARCHEEMKHFHKAISLYYKVFEIKKSSYIVPMEYDACRIYSFHFLLRLLVSFKRYHDSVKLIADMTRQYPEIKSDYSKN